MPVDNNAFLAGLEEEDQDPIPGKSGTISQKDIDESVGGIFSRFMESAADKGGRFFEGVMDAGGGYCPGVDSTDAVERCPRLKRLLDAVAKLLRVTAGVGHGGLLL